MRVTPLLAALAGPTAVLFALPTITFAFVVPTTRRHHQLVAPVPFPSTRNARTSSRSAGSVICDPVRPPFPRLASSRCAYRYSRSRSAAPAGRLRAAAESDDAGEDSSGPTEEDKTGDAAAATTKGKKGGLSVEATLYMALLALQFGLQPGLVKKFTPQTICRSSVVMVQELLKVLISALFFFGPGTSTEKRTDALDGWSIKAAIAVGGVPAFLYCIQNMAALMAYQNLEPLTFNVLNQTKTMSAALCCYLIIGRKQSKRQMISLVILLASALIIEKVVTLTPPFLSFGGGGGAAATATAGAAAATARHFTHGVVPVLLASFISGLAGALSQKNLQSASGDAKGGRNPYLFNMEMNFFSALILAVSLLFSADGRHIRQLGFFDGWMPQTMIPVVTNAMGGIIVGLVTKYAGSVRKGFALIFGILISGLWEVQTVGITREQIVGGVLAAVSLWMHTAFPYRTREERRKARSKEA